MAVKSFQGPRADSEKAKPVNILVRDIMTTNIVTFKIDESIHDVMKVLIKNRIMDRFIYLEGNNICCHNITH